jgi:hypothetical protein
VKQLAVPFLSKGLKNFLFSTNLKRASSSCSITGSLIILVYIRSLCEFYLISHKLFKEVNNILLVFIFRNKITKLLDI